jgi:hypothetical protein
VEKEGLLVSSFLFFNLIASLFSPFFSSAQRKKKRCSASLKRRIEGCVCIYTYCGTNHQLHLLLLSFFFSQTDQLIMAGAAEYNQETHGM